jgi:hypothetical protein
MAGYVLGDLTPAQVHQLLALHPELVGEVEQLQEVLALLPLALPEVYPSPQLRSQILKNAQINLESEFQTSPQIFKESYFAKYLNKTFLVGGIMSALLVGIDLDSYRTRQQLAIAQGELSSYQKGTVMLQIPIDQILMGAKSVVITLEPKQSAPESKGEMVMQGAVCL